jgi:putative Mg2+ transporter-C (MgtC) family protein
MQLSPDVLSPGSSAFWQHVATALVCGGSIGIERKLRGKVAGIRTSILICLGTAIFVSLGASFAPDRGDPTRVLGQVVTGIGFLGAGVILARGERIQGVTTAAVIWVLAALGSLIGFGYLRAALVLTLVTLAVLLGVEKFESLSARGEGRSRRSGDHPGPRID